MQEAIYHDLVAWYRLLDPLEDHEEDADAWVQAVSTALGDKRGTLLELGAGAGNNAYFLKRIFDCTLTDVSEQMLDLSRAVNPDCTHKNGDMRSLRLDQTFDVVLAHDSISYMLNEADIRAAIATAFNHTRPGGVAIFAPDCTKESFQEQSQILRGDDGSRSLRCLDWTWDPDPKDTTYQVDYAFLLRDGERIQAVHDTHIEGLFSRDTWIRVLTEAGFEVEILLRELGDDGEVVDCYTNESFLCRR